MAIYLDGKQVDKLPAHALAAMSERLSDVVSGSFSQHPDEYERFLAGRERRRAESEPKKKKTV